MSKKYIFITGGNRGIGLAVAESCLKADPCVCVILGTRSLENGNQAKLNLLTKSDDFKDRVDVIQISVTDQQSVDQAVNTFQKRYDKGLYALVNNAGVGYDFSWLGFETRSLIGRDTLDCNYYGVIRCFEAFKSELLKSKTHTGVLPRVVNLSSYAAEQHLSKIDSTLRGYMFDDKTSIEDLNKFVERFVEAYESTPAEEKGMRNGDGFHLQAYGFSKAALCAYTQKIGNEYKDKMLINSCHPGFIHTGMTETYPQPEHMTEPSSGAVCPTKLCLDKNLTDTGKYFNSDGTLKSLW